MDKFSPSGYTGEVTNLIWAGSQIRMGSSIRNIKGNKSINRTWMKNALRYMKHG